MVSILMLMTILVLDQGSRKSSRSAWKSSSS